MGYTRDWDETSPEDTAKAGNGAQEIRHFKVDIKERYDDVARGEKRISWNNLTNTALPTIVAGSWCEIAGTERPIDSLVTPSDATGASGARWIKLIDTGGTITAEVTATAPVYNSTYLGFYGVSSYAAHRYVMSLTKSSTGVYVDKTSMDNIVISNYFKALTAAGSWVAPFSAFFDIECIGLGGSGGSGASSSPGFGGGGGGGGSSARGIIRKFIEAGTSWTFSLSTASGGNNTFSDGTTTLTFQNGYTGGTGGSDGQSGLGGAGGATPTGFDLNYGGNDGSDGVAVSVGSSIGGGTGGAGALGGGGGGFSLATSSRAGKAANNPGGGGGGGCGGTSTYTPGAGGAGGGHLIVIRNS